MPDSSDSRGIARRSLLAGAAMVPAAALQAAAQKAGTVFSERQKRCLEAFTNRLVPEDEYGPGAVECGVVEYIERSLGDPQVGGKAVVQVGLDAVDAFSRETQGAPLAELSPEKQDAVLTAIEKNEARGFTPNSSTFFGLIRRLTLEGMFGDPFYGGNRNFAGWDLIRYPGPRLAVAAEDQRMGVAIKPVRYSVNHGH